jgi:hypothetical protein
MKKLKGSVSAVLKFSAFIMAALVLAFCTGLPGTADETGPFFITVYGETVPAFEDSSLSDAELDLSFSLADVSEERLAPVVRGALYGGTSVESYALKVIDDLKTAYLETLSENSNWGVDQSWSYSEEHTVLVKSHYAVVSQSRYEYMGGAHGNGSVSYHVFDLEVPCRLTLADIINKNKQDALDALVDRKLRALSEETNGESLPDSLPLSAGIYMADKPMAEDFFPSSKGLHLQWDPYEIAAYAFGGIEVVLDWGELDKILSAEGQKLAAVYSR